MAARTAAILLLIALVLLTDAIPNIEEMGRGSIIFVDFPPFKGQANAFSTLILYPISIHYVPLLLGTAVFLHWHKTTTSKKGAQ